MEVEAFLETVADFYVDNKRDFLAWRQPDQVNNFDPYAVVVSEMMLQQTQVDRVTPKYVQFLEIFPDVASLASANLQKVLSTWSGLGYNRRAKYLHDFARDIVASRSNFPDTLEGLTAYKGIGKNTAAAVMVYAYNQRQVFIETNIRTVYIYHFFQDNVAVTDADVISKLSETLSSLNNTLFYDNILGAVSFRNFYWALMDYGTYLKKKGVKNAALSSSYKKQSKFDGSSRQLRGKILKELVSLKTITFEELKNYCADERFEKTIYALENEGLVVMKAGLIRIA